LNPLIKSQRSAADKCGDSQDLRNVGAADAPHTHRLVQDSAALAPDLARLVEAWPTLPQPVKAGIAAMVEAHAKGAE